MSRTKKLWVASMMVAAMVVQAVGFAGVVGASNLQLKATPGDLLYSLSGQKRTINVTWNPNDSKITGFSLLSVTVDGKTYGHKIDVATGHTSINVALNKQIDIHFLVLKGFWKFERIGSTSVVATP
jgi:hypothetical protein